MILEPKKTAEDVYEHAQFTGLRNTVPPERLSLNDLTRALNVDIDDSLLVSRRTGFEQFAAGNFHSFWSDTVHAFAVFNQTDLVQIQPDLSITTLRTGLTPNLYMSFDTIGPEIVHPESTWRIYFSNGVETGVIDTGRVRSWGIKVPLVQPTPHVIGGTLKAGAYQYAITYRRKDLQESGSLDCNVIVLPSSTPTVQSKDKGIQFENIVPSDDPDVTDIIMYVTRCDGASLYRVGVVPNGTTSYTYDHETNTLTLPMRHQHLRPPLPFEFIAGFNGHILGVLGNRLYRSEPYGLELFDYRRGYEFTDKITLVGALNSGVYLGCVGKIFYLNGPTPSKWSSKPIAEYGAIPGAFDYVSLDMLGMQGQGMAVLFATTRGLCVGIDGGQFINLTQEKFVYPIQERGAVVVRRHKGMIQALLTMQGREQSPGAAVQRNEAWIGGSTTVS